ncbi:MAG: hypothetical protein IT550_10090 [Novosphingobium sp.]|jgi:hypothetical protein|nr:hypothetical protein [Novosphingobium sp.]
MYDFIDRPVNSLDPGGRFLVWAMRSWVSAMSMRACPASVLGLGFARWRVIAGLQPFLRTMALFNRKGLETFHFCALGCNHVSEHEAIIISLLCSLHDDRPEVVTDTLGLLVEDDAIGDMIEALATLARVMETARILPTRGAWLPEPTPRAGSAG